MKAEPITFFSLCSGIEAASVAWEPLGWKCVGHSEIEKFPRAVLTRHWPDLKNYGDLTKQEEWADVPEFDVLVAGTPCQGFSIAGRREGMADPRSQLVWHFIDFAARHRPRWLLWENVPGALSSNKGRDFGAVLGALAKCGYGFAYRVLDAQWYGVAQRRRRVFVVGYLGDWRPAAAVLFEREGLRWNPPPSREERETVTRDVAPSLRGQSNSTHRADSEAYVAHAPDIVPQAMSSKWSKGSSGPAGDEHHNLVPVAFNSKQDGADAGEVAPPLRAMNHDKSHANAGGQVAIAFANAAGARHGDPGCVASPTMVRRLTPRECERLQGFPDDHTLIATDRRLRRKVEADYLKYLQRTVDKRITVEEAQKLAADGHRYRALGNSMAVPVMRWLGERIALIDAELKE